VVPHMDTVEAPDGEHGAGEGALGNVAEDPHVRHCSAEPGPVNDKWARPTGGFLPLTGIFVFTTLFMVR
jgi:hypothetical protein